MTTLRRIDGTVIAERDGATVDQLATVDRANLSWANLYRANLNGTDLREANLYRANLSWANLYRANLNGTNLREANLYRANLSWANLHGANLSGADLRWADLSGANLRRANLSGANLRRANLSGAYLSGAYLSGANLRRANLSGAYLSGAYLSGAEWSSTTQWPSPTMLLLANWCMVSADLTRDLMIWDACNHPDPQRFDAWAAGGACPYDGVSWQRAANFCERRELWPGWAKVMDGTYPCDAPINLARRLLAECCVEVTS